MPFWAKTTPRLVTMVVLPSRGSVLVISRVRMGSSTPEYWTFVRKVRKASETGERGEVLVMGLPSSAACLEMTPKTGRPRAFLTSSGVLRVSSTASITKITPTASMKPDHGGQGGVAKDLGADGFGGDDGGVDLHDGGDGLGFGEADLLVAEQEVGVDGAILGDFRFEAGTHAGVVFR